MIKSLLTTVVGLSMTMTLFSQQDLLPKYQSPEEIYDIGIDYYEDEEYTKAYDQFMRIDYRDTAYFKSRKFAINCAQAGNKYDTVITVSKAVLGQDEYNPYKEEFYNFIGHALIQKEKYEESISYIDDALKEYPRSYILRFNRAMALSKLERYDEAVAEYQESIRYNPHYLWSHIELGRLCARAGDYAKAAMAMNIGIYTNAYRGEGVDGIIALEEVYNGNIENDIDHINYREEESFDDLDLMIKNKLALNAKYKVKNKLSYPFIRHNQLLISSLKYDPQSNDFWNQTYVKFLAEVWNRDAFNQYTYYQCVSVDQPRTQQIVTKQTKKIKAFVQWSLDYFVEAMNDRKIWNGTGYEDNMLVHRGAYGFNEEGERKSDGTFIGEYKSYNFNGLLEAEGQLNNSGEKIGTWRYYDEMGRIEVQQDFVEDKLDGNRYSYYHNGSRKQLIPIKNDKIDGFVENYFNIDQPMVRMELDDAGVKNGKTVYYYKNGQVSAEMTFVDDKIDGVYKRYYSNGQLSEETLYDNGELEGKFKTFHRNGAVNIEGEYKDDKPFGHWKYYHDNGQLIEEGDFKDGERIGVWESYRYNGQLESVSDFGTTGKKTGVYKEYDFDGKLSIELTYKGEDIISYKTYSSKGEVLASGELKKKELEFVNYHSNGVKSVEGKYYKGNEVGEWKYYDNQGHLTSRLNFNEDGERDGDQKWYFEDGELETIKTYKDGELHGLYVDYYRNGKIFRQGWYNEGEVVGRWITYYRNGEVQNDEYYQEGEAQGDVVYYDVVGKKRETSLYYYGSYMGTVLFDSTGAEYARYELDKGEGVFDFKDINGKVYNHKEFKGATGEGQTKSYLPDGTVTREGQYSSGDNVGEFKWYHNDGSLATTGSYKDDERHGTWKWYFEGSDQLSQVNEYIDGKKVGTEYQYHENGKLEAEVSYRDGDRHGKSTYYDEFGEVQYILFHENDYMLGYSYLGSDGKPVEMIEFDRNNGEMKTYYKNGKVSYEATYKNGFIEGKSSFYMSNGKPEMERNFIKGDLDGEYKTYYANGKVKSFIHYKDDQKHGEMIEYYSTGKKKIVTNYVLGTIHGWVTYYDKNGNQTKREYYYNGRLIKTEA